MTRPGRAAKNRYSISGVRDRAGTRARRAEACRARGVRTAECGVRSSVAYGWYFSSTVSAAPDLGFMVTRTVTLLVFAAFSNCSTVHLEVP